MSIPTHSYILNGKRTVSHTRIEMLLKAFHMLSGSKPPQVLLYFAGPYEAVDLSTVLERAWFMADYYGFENVGKMHSLRARPKFFPTAQDVVDSKEFTDWYDCGKHKVNEHLRSLNLLEEP